MADDFTNTTSTTGSVSVGGSATGSIDAVDDTDWFRVSLQAGRQYRFEVRGNPTGNGTLVDPYVSVRNGSGIKLLEDDDSGTGANALLTYTATSSGTYFLGAGAGFNPNGTGTYRVYVTDVTPAVNQTPSATGSSRTVAPGTSIALSSLFSWSDPDGASDVVGFSVRDATAGGGHLALNGVVQSDNVVYGNSTFGISISQIGQWTYIAGTNGAVDTINFNAIDSQGAFNLPAATATITAQSTNSAPTASGTDRTLAPGAVVPLSSLFSYADADGIGDVTGFAVRDATAGGGHLALDGVAQADNVVFGNTATGLPISQLSRWTYVAGPAGSTDSLRFTAVDSQQAFNATAAVAVVTAQAGPDYTISTASARIGEADGTLRVTISRQATGAVETVYFSTTQTFGTNNLGDYTKHLNTAVTFSAASATATVTIAITDDTIAEADESFGMIVQRNGSDPLSTFLATSSFTIVDNDAVQTGDDDFADEPTDLSAPVGNLAIGSGITGRIGVADANDIYGDKDVFAVTLTGGQNYHFQLTGNASGGTALPTGIFTIRDGASFTTILATSPILASPELVFQAPTSGTYYVRVGTGGAATDQGGYRLSATAIAAVPDDYKDTPVDTGNVVTLLSNQSRSGIVEVAGDKDIFAVNFVEGRTYQFSLTARATGGDALDTHYMSVRGVPGSFDTYSGQGGSFITFRATNTGTGYVRVGAGGSGSDTGGYLLTMVDKGVVPVIMSPPPNFSADPYQQLKNDTVTLTGFFNEDVMDALAFTEAMSDIGRGMFFAKTLFDPASYIRTFSPVLSALGYAAMIDKEIVGIMSVGPDQRWRQAFIELTSDLIGIGFSYGTRAFVQAVATSIPVLGPLLGIVSGGLIGEGAGKFAGWTYFRYWDDQYAEPALGTFFDALSKVVAQQEGSGYIDPEAGNLDLAALTYFDPVWYLDNHADALAALKAGTINSAYEHYMLYGLDLGYAPNAGQSVTRAELGIITPEFVRANEAVFDLTLGDFAGDGVSAAEAAVAARITQVALRPDMQVDGLLSAIASRKALDLLSNWQGRATVDAAVEPDSQWAVDWSNGDALTQPFRAEMETILGVDVPDSAIKLFVLSSAETNPAVIHANLASQPGFAATMATSTFDTIGIAEMGGIWVIIVADRAAGFIPSALGSDRLISTRQFGSIEADTLFAGARQSTIQGFDGDDQLVGSVANDQLNGGTGQDLLYGRSGDDVLVGGADNDELHGDDGRDTLTGDDGNDTLIGGPGDDVLTGGNGIDALVGGAGGNQLAGGTGDDYYTLSSNADTVIELAGEGTDEILVAHAVQVLPDNVENLRYIGVGNFAGIGNALDNILTGGTGRDELHGGAGNDTLDDGGGAQADSLLGGSGNDVFIIGVRGSSTIEAVDAGTDEVRTSIPVYGLQANIENLTFTDNAEHGAGVGNALDNWLRGGIGADTLFGREGDDVLLGGGGIANTLLGQQGNDWYLVATEGDSVIEFAGEGFDSVRTSTASFVLKDNVENLFAASLHDFIGVGNDLDNQIEGNAGNDLLNGLGGNDILKGGGGSDLLMGGEGRDQFRYDGTETIVDRILDFTSGSDRIMISASGFARTPTISVVQAPSPVVANANSTFLHNTATGMLSYDPDGTGAALPILLAQLNPGLALAATDFGLY